MSMEVSEIKRPRLEAWGFPTTDLVHKFIHLFFSALAPRRETFAARQDAKTPSSVLSSIAGQIGEIGILGQAGDFLQKLL
jgi:hypothetical protein